MSKICGRGTASNSLVDWQLDELATPNGSNAVIDGAEFEGDTLTAATKLNNYLQISRKDLVVTRRSNKVNKAGRKSELAYQLGKLGKELKRDMETILTGNQAALAGNNSTAPLTASLCAWLTTNTERGTGGTDATLSNTTYGYPNAAAGDGTQAAFSESDFLNVIRDCFIEGGDPTCALMSPTVKQRFSNYMFGSTARIATQYQDQGSSPRGGVTAAGAVDYYVSDFGTIEVMPNRFQRDRDVFVLDKDMWEIKYLDSFKTETVAKTGDAEKRMILVDYALCSKNEAASGVIADVDPAVAMVA